MDFSLIIGSLPIYFSGLWTTVWLVGLSLVIGLSIAIPLAIARNSRNYVISTPAWGYIYFFRGTPLLVQLYLIYYGMDQFFPVKGTLWEKRLVLCAGRFRIEHVGLYCGNYSRCHQWFAKR